ncbi:MAG: AmmeMemoRadiSam system protein A [Polyangiales bacterium]
MITLDEESAALAYVRAVIAERLGGAAARAPRGGIFDQRVPNFVTVYEGHRLQGCIGNLDPREELSRSLAYNAVAAAFDDPRNQELTLAQVPSLTIELSLLSPRVKVAFTSEREAREALRPQVDGALLEWDGYRGVFLPQVWKQLPNPKDFLDHLKVKAGLRRDFWAEDVSIERFTIHEFYDGPTPPG